MIITYIYIINEKYKMNKKTTNRKRKKEFIKKCKHKNKSYVNNYQQLVVKHTNSLWVPPNDLNLVNHETQSWYNLKIHQQTSIESHYKVTPEEKQSITEIINCKKVNLILTTEQKEIINRWFNAYQKMYNETIKFIKNQHNTNQKTILSFKTLRTYHLKQIRDDIIENSQISTFKRNVRIKTHVLDYAIKLACANYKSALTNLKRGNIRYFRIRYWRTNRSTKILDIEAQYFKKGTFCFRELGQVKCEYNQKEYKLDEIKTTCKIHYNVATKKYILFVPEKSSPLEANHKRDIISLDPGIRCFMTGVSENEVLKIAENSSSIIKKHLQKIDKYNNKNIPNKIKKKNEKKNNKKITNLVDDLHWKSIKFLTDRYRNILIGNLSIKGITSNKSSVLTDMTKRIGYRLKFYQYRQRLEYKCNQRQSIYKLIDESYTSKICSVCGYKHDKLGGNHTYDCHECSVKMDRDVNGCRGIYIKQFM